MRNITPTISVIMATHNTPHKWLKESIESILNQTFTDFEFIIVDDCSSLELKPDYDYYKDSRIKWIINEENIGLTKSLNIALKIAKGKYIARMDADDICLPERFEVQVKYMDEHPDVIVSGAYRRAFGNQDKDEIWNLPETREEQQVQLFFFNCGVTHPTAMIRKSMLDEYGITYNEKYKKAQDYGLWVQCTRYAPMAMIPQVLLKYRKSEQQITNQERTDVKKNDSKIKIDQLAMLGIAASEDEQKLHIAFCSNDTSMDPDDMKTWVFKLKEFNNRALYLDKRIFEKELKKRWYLWCKKAFKEEGKIEAKKAYKKAVTIEYRLQDAKLYLKRKIARFARR
ncbi:glycosyltransferase [Blautia glucerasea]